MRFKEDKFHGYSWNRMASNGWSWEKNKSLETDDYDVFSMTFLVTYKVKVYACIARCKKHLCVDGYLGVLWLESEYEYDRPLSISELGEMKEGMAYAEDNLLLIGIPFSPDYKFIDDAEEKTKRNMELREKLKLAEQENENE